MQFAVPQFTDVEDKLIGPLTLKQFLVLLGTGGLVLFFWSLLGLSIFFFIFALPIGLLGIVLTFAKYNGRPFFTYLFPFLSFFASPKILVFKREVGTILLPKIEVKKPEKSQVQDLEPAESRLKKLAYLLDQKAGEEEELIEKQL